MEDIIRLYNNIMDLETDMLLNPDKYDEKQKEKYYKTIKLVKENIRKSFMTLNLAMISWI